MSINHAGGTLPSHYKYLHVSYTQMMSINHAGGTVAYLALLKLNQGGIMAGISNLASIWHLGAIRE